MRPLSYCHGTDASAPRIVMEDGFARSPGGGPRAGRELRTASWPARNPDQGPREPAQAQLDQFLQASFVRSDRIEAQTSRSSQREETRRAARTSPGLPSFGPSREGPRDGPLQAVRLSSLWSW